MENIFQPNEEFATNAHIKSMDEYHTLVKKANDNYEGFWKEFADEKIDWLAPYDKVLDESDAPFYKWFTDGKLNVSNQCIDRHLADKADKIAILFEGDRGDVEKIQLTERMIIAVNEDLCDGFSLYCCLPRKCVVH